ncbi:CheA signal transduction histidine kinases [Magnetococcus marinus MC-1]|uniref:Chemotaxis protein CheA n=1 Tax=Magnetococcus marinus (strain ATCC BAA-1437 / JCM 17883 / MC-1) TaxID=156889 RepID=A0L8P9_MAGMM|nr:hybrid sensor histidine kinase/response regulator [Magnetococcus marinus]ABK44342.1 CheA signal transduction histidine kinases [Magnetococcus marinus MC-1]
MELDADFLNELLATFRAELEDQTAIMGDGLLALEKGQDEQARQETIHQIFRAAHNVKGAARGVEIRPLADLSHRLESLFSALQKQNATPNPGVISLALAAVDQMRQLGMVLIPGEPTPAEITALLDQLDQAAQGRLAGQNVEASVAASPSPPPTKAPTARFEQQTEPMLPTALAAPLSQENRTQPSPQAEPQPQAEYREQEPSPPHTSAPSSGENHKPHDAITETAIPAAPQQLHERSVEVAEPISAMDEEIPKQVEEPHSPAGVAGQASAAPTGEQSQAPIRHQTPVMKSAVHHEMVRVSATKINEAIGLAEEIQISKVQMEGLQAGVRRLEGNLLNLLHQITCLGDFSEDGMGMPDPALWRDFAQNAPDLMVQLKEDLRATRYGVKERAKRLGLLSNNLQSNLRMMRLVPLSTMTRPMARTARDLCVELGKLADFKVVGDEIELDRAVLEQLKDPLTHLLRNAVDHAIETPQARLAAGKPERGVIQLEIIADGGTIRLVLEDDGRGLDLQRIKEKAIRERLIGAEDAHMMDDEAITELIFMPGFSSRDEVTSVSGRGVGLDVVRANLRHINGQVRVRTQHGKGTQFVLTVPLTLATERGLLVELAGEVFALSISHVERIRSVPRSAVRTLEAGPAVVLDGRPMPLHSLADLLNISGSRALSLNPMPVVILSKGWHQMAVVVDDVVGEQEIVVKPFQPPLCSVKHLKGGNLDRNGNIVVVLDSASLVDAALENRTAPLPLEGQEAGTSINRPKVPHILVVDDSITTRTLEKNILEAKGFLVTTAVNGQKGWETLQEGQFDLVISDVEMPIMNGFEFARTIRDDSRYDDLPVIIVSSLDSQENKRRGMEAGADAYIVKGSFETATLLQTVRQLLAIEN